VNKTNGKNPHPFDCEMYVQCKDEDIESTVRCDNGQCFHDGGDGYCGVCGSMSCEGICMHYLKLNIILANY